ncbi:protocadherin gamma-A7-like isoform X2 [Ptychodera flava]
MLYSIIDGTGMDYFDFEVLNQTNIMITDSLDFELRPEHKLTLMVDDREGRNSTTEMDVFIVDEDDMTPVFTDVIYESEVYENVEHIVLEVTPKVHAYDQDFGINETVYYSFADISRQNDSNYESGHFNIDHGTADINLISGLDRENLESGKFSLMIRAAQISSHGYPIYSYRDTLASLVVTVLDVNNNAPTMSHAKTSVGICTVRNDYLRNHGRRLRRRK